MCFYYTSFTDFKSSFLVGCHSVAITGYCSTKFILLDILINKIIKIINNIQLLCLNYKLVFDAIFILCLLVSKCILYFISFIIP